MIAAPEIPPGMPGAARLNEERRGGRRKIVLPGLFLGALGRQMGKIPVFLLRVPW